MFAAEFKNLIVILCLSTVFSFSLAYGLQAILKLKFKEQARIFEGLTTIVGIAIVAASAHYFKELMVVPVLAYVLGAIVGMFKYWRSENRAKRQAELKELQSRFKLAFALDDGKATVAITEFHPKVMQHFIDFCLHEGLNVISEHHYRSGKIYLHISR